MSSMPGCRPCFAATNWGPWPRRSKGRRHEVRTARGRQAQGMRVEWRRVWSRARARPFPGRRKRSRGNLNSLSVVQLDSSASDMKGKRPIHRNVFPLTGLKSPRPSVSRFIWTASMPPMNSPITPSRPSITGILTGPWLLITRSILMNLGDMKTGGKLSIRERRIRP